MRLTEEQFAALVQAELADLGNMLLEKNRKYGNSALDPVRIFSRADIEEQIRVRLDDKLSRLARGASEDEDVERDIMGYLMLMRIARRLRANVKKEATPLGGWVCRVCNKTVNVGQRYYLGESSLPIHESCEGPQSGATLWERQE